MAVMDRASNEDWTRLGHVIVSRINELGITRAEVQDRGGPSPAKIREIVNGRSTTLSPSKRRDLERALLWQSNSIDEVLAGGDAIPVDPRAQQLGDDLTDLFERYVESQPGLLPGEPLKHETVRGLFLAVEDLRDAMIDAHSISPEVIGQLKPALDAVTQRLDEVLTEHFGGKQGVGAAFTYLMGWHDAPPIQRDGSPVPRDDLARRRNSVIADGLSEVPDTVPLAANESDEKGIQTPMSDGEGSQVDPNEDDLDHP